jgi:hypothetical protein
MQQLNLADKVVQHIAGGSGAFYSSVQPKPSCNRPSRGLVAAASPQLAQPVVHYFWHHQIPAMPLMIQLNGRQTSSRSLPPSDGSACAYA